MQQMNMFEALKPRYEITKPVRLIELFAGIGSQAKALKNLNIPFEHHFICEYDKYAVRTYNAIHNTNFKTSDIREITAKDLNITDTDKYEYILTYSFPCTNLSIAGKGEGMSKGSNTRSGLLWEVERLLDECKELPQILLMENVPQVISKKHFKDFREWQIKLEKLGYSSYFELLNAKDYGIPQNRNRCFMMSILGDYYYEFPKPFELELRLKDMLEEEVDEKYYLSAKMINFFRKNSKDNEEKGNGFRFTPKCPEEVDYAKTITTNNGSRMDDNFVIEPSCLNSKVNGKQPKIQDRVYDCNSISTAITTCFMPSIAIPEATKQGYALASDGDGVYINRPHQKRGCVQKGMIQTIKTSPNDVGVVVKNNIKNINDENNVFSTLGTNCGSSTSAGGGVVVVKGNYSPSNHNASRIVDKNGLAPTVMENHGTVTAVAQRGRDNGQQLEISDREYANAIRIRKLTPRECFRLMGFTDEDFDKASKVNSNAQLYKQAGNSICVPVLEKIFGNLVDSGNYNYDYIRKQPEIDESQISLF